MKSKNLLEHTPTFLVILLILLIAVFLKVFLDGVELSVFLEALTGAIGILFSGLLVFYQLDRSSKDQLELEYIKCRPALNVYYQKINDAKGQPISFLYRYDPNLRDDTALQYVNSCIKGDCLWTLTINLSNSQPIHNVIVYLPDIGERYYIEKILPNQTYALLLQSQLKNERMRDIFPRISQKGIVVCFQTELKEFGYFYYSVKKHPSKDFWHVEKNSEENYSITKTEKMGLDYYGHLSCLTISPDSLGN